MQTDGGPKSRRPFFDLQDTRFRAASDKASGLPKRIDHFDGYGIRRLRFAGGKRRRLL